MTGLSVHDGRNAHYAEESAEWQQRLREAHTCWQGYAKATARVRAGPTDSTNGMGWRFFYTLELIDLAKSRLDEIKSVLKLHGDD